MPGKNSSRMYEPAVVTRPCTLGQLRNLDIAKPEPVIADLINEGETILFVGRPKVGKSRLVQQVSLCISRSEAFLNHAVLKARQVLLIDLENRPYGVRSRFELMAGPNSADDRIHIYAPETLAEGDVNVTASGIKRLEALIAECNAEVLIIDTWRLFVGGDENSQEIIVKALKALSAVRCKSPKLTIILVHHLRKEKMDTAIRLMEDPHSWVEGVSGHHALVGHVDACYGLERYPHKGEEIVVFGGVARNAAQCAMLLEDDEETLKFEASSGESAVALLMTPKEREYWQVAKAKGEFTWTSLKEETRSKNKKALASMLRKAEHHGLLRRADKQYTVMRG